ncbi:hypothetical protein IGJ34_000077 [Enterococcus sp. AZ177]
MKKKSFLILTVVVLVVSIIDIKYNGWIERKR